MHNLMLQPISLQQMSWHMPEHLKHLLFCSFFAFQLTTEITGATFIAIIIIGIISALSVFRLAVSIISYIALLSASSAT
jgi:hypothetical protein